MIAAPWVTRECTIVLEKREIQLCFMTGNKQMPRHPPAIDLHAIVQAKDLAVLLDVTPIYVAKLAETGVIQRNADGRYELLGSVRAFVRKQRAERRAAGTNHGATTSYATQRERLTKAKADLAEMRQKQLSGEMVPAAAIEQGWGALLNALRTRLLAIPTKATPRVMAARNATETLAILRGLVHEALNELSNAKIECAGPARR